MHIRMLESDLTFFSRLTTMLTAIFIATKKALVAADA